MPLVSFIVPCFGQWKYLGDAIDSIAKQTVKDHETILICGKSGGWAEGDKMSLITSIVWFRDGAPLAEARNAGLRLSQAKYVVPLDADDTIESTFLEKTLEIAEGFNFKAVAVNSEAILTEAVFNSNPYPYCALFDRRTLLSMNGWEQPTEQQGIEDWDLWIRFYDSPWNSMKAIPDHLFNWRRHPDSMSSQWEGKPIFEKMKADLLRKHGR